MRWALAPAMMIGSLLGVAAAAALTGATLRSLIGVFIILAAIYVFLDRKPEASRPLPGAVGLSGAGSIIGFISALAGIGGGLLTTPFLLWHGRRIRDAIGTAAACTIPVALAGAIGFAAVGWTDGDGLAFSTGFVYWPGVAGIASGSMFGAICGARLSHRTAAPVLRRMFSILIALIGLDMSLH
ncbi:MAG: sulfite exporter TauE/SafE family protein [Gammaproteobacteria bacterium]